jgi:hypothetical protein
MLLKSGLFCVLSTWSTLRCDIKVISHTPPRLTSHSECNFNMHRKHVAQFIARNLLSNDLTWCSWTLDNISASLNDLWYFKIAQCTWPVCTTSVVTTPHLMNLIIVHVLNSELFLQIKQRTVLKIVSCYITLHSQSIIQFKNQIIDALLCINFRLKFW